jgi:hypothetical protein
MLYLLSVFGCFWGGWRVVSSRRLSYGAGSGAVRAFVDGNSVVGEFLAKFKAKSGTYNRYARDLCLFFNWLREKKGLEMVPEELLNEHLRRRAGLQVEDRRWALKLALEFSRDNPDFAGESDSHKYVMFTAIKQFFAYHEADLTSSRAVFGKRVKRKFKTKQFSVADVKKILGCLKQRERTICLVQLQSGQGIGEVLNRFNFMFDYVDGYIKAGAERIRIDFDERKGNDFNYFSFISRDAIQELKKWFAVRKKWLKHARVDSNAIFITRTGKPYTVQGFMGRYAEQVTKAGFRTGPFSVNSHKFRKLFKTESRPPERGIDQDCVEFMMGHLSGIESIGGVYDKTPELYAGVIEREYAKLEPYINIYSGKAAETEGLGISEEDLASLKQLLPMMKEGKVKIMP